MLVVGHKAIRLAEGERPPGAPIPEAAEWPNLRSYIETGRIVRNDTMLRVGERPIKLSPTETRNPGEPIPEAASWQNLHSYIETGRIIVSDEATPPLAAPETSSGGTAEVSGRPATPSSEEKRRGRR